MSRFGIDALGGVKYQKALLAALSSPGAFRPVGIFLRTFGDARKTVAALAKSNRCTDIVVHLAPFDSRPGHPYPKKLTPQMKKDARWLNALAEAHPATFFLISPFCEHPHSAKIMAPIFTELRQLAPACIPLNSVLKDNNECPGTITEIHLESSTPRKKPKGEYTVSFDGFGGDGSGDFTDADVPSILARYADARHIRCWDFRFNGKHGHLDKTQIDKRKHWPDEKYIRSRQACMKEREGAVSWPPSMLFKPCADDHGSAEPTKDNRAMCIMPVSAGAVMVFDSHGNPIDKMNRMLPDHSGQPRGARFYSKRYAYELGDIAAKNTGSRLIKIHNSPLTDADLRSNRFR